MTALLRDTHTKIPLWLAYLTTGEKKAGTKDQLEILTFHRSRTGCLKL